jgi:hypothetical protein
MRVVMVGVACVWVWPGCKGGPPGDLSVLMLYSVMSSPSPVQLSYE